MTTYYVLLILGLVFFNGAALVVLHWALRTGQFRHPSRTALQIFDEQEPIGTMTDYFPSRRRGDAGKHP